MNKITTALSILGFSVSASVFAGGTHGGHEAMMNNDSVNPAGQPGSLKEVNRTIDITMHDTMRYNLDELQVKSGETIRFKILNKGLIPHEFTLGDRKALLKHQSMMRNMPAMVHSEANAVTLKPGESGEIIWTFSDSDTLMAACFIPGHFEAGMSMAIQTDKH